MLTTKTDLSDGVSYSFPHMINTKTLLKVFLNLRVRNAIITFSTLFVDPYIVLNAGKYMIVVGFI